MSVAPYIEHALCGNSPAPSYSSAAKNPDLMFDFIAVNDERIIIFFLNIGLIGLFIQ